MDKKKPKMGLFGFFLVMIIYYCPAAVRSQHVKDAPRAFRALSPEPKVILMDNKIEVPLLNGHLQGVQVIEVDGARKLIISGSSQETAYILQADLATLKIDNYIPLMKEPYRHAGGIQISEPYLSVGIEDNIAKTFSKVSVYNYLNDSFQLAIPTITIGRKGKAEMQTAGAVGLLARDNDYLAVVGNWDSRNWDFYSVNPEKKEETQLESFSAPEDWASYQAINLICDNNAIYAIGFYKKELMGHADLIFISKLDSFDLVMKKVDTKSFNCKNGVDFGSAAGLEVDKEGKLHIWGTQRDALKQIAVNRFSEL